MNIPQIPQSFLTKVRTTGLDNQGQPVKRVIAEGGEPCRDVLRRARPGEELILASFTPFSVAGPYKEFGPIFVLANASDEEVARDAFPITDYFRDQFVIRAYSRNEEIVDAAMTQRASAESTIKRFFAKDDVAFLHVRFPTYGCFALRLDR